MAGPEAAALDRRVRAADRLTRDIAERKTRIKALVRQLMPMSPLTGKITRADLAVLERWADPNLLVKVGAKRLAALIARSSNNHTGVERAQEWLAAANAAIDLYAGHLRGRVQLTSQPRSPPRSVSCASPRPSSPARGRTRDRLSLG